MKNRAIIPLVLGLVVGFLAIKFSVDAIQRAQGARPEIVEIEVVVAGEDINASTRIKPDMLMVRRTPKTPLVPADAFSSMEDLVDRVTKKFIPQGIPITATMLAEDGTLPGIEERIEEGFRAVAVKIDESTGVAYLLRPGSFVDVIVVMDVKKSGHKSETISRVLLQRVKVGAVGQMLNDATAEDGPSRVRSVTLIVPEGDVPKLHLAQTKGRLTLAMRSENDMLITDEAEAQQGELFGEKKQADAVVGPPAPPPAVAPADEPECKTTPAVVTVVNGGDVYRLVYKGSCSMELLGVQRGLTEGDSGATFHPGSGGRGGALPGPRTLHSERDRRLRRSGAQSTTSDVAPRDNDDTDDYEEVGE